MAEYLRDLVIEKLGLDPQAEAYFCYICDELHPAMEWEFTKLYCGICKDFTHVGLQNQVCGETYDCDGDFMGCHYGL